MTTKILLADDSLTIQKVIQITLASEPFEIINCAKSEEITGLLKQHTPSIVLLDFNLSETKTGYDLCQEIKEIDGLIEVVMMFGTFDNIDEEALKKCHCYHHIVKPFDSNKFISLCRSIALKNEEPIKDIFEPTPVLTRPAPINNTAQAFDEKYENWNVRVPGVIGKEAGVGAALPPVINQTKAADQAFPDSADLDYPEIEIKLEAINEMELDYHPNSKLSPISDLKLEPIDEKSSDKGTDIFDLNEFDFNKDHADDIKILEDQIKDEIEGDLWKIDEEDSDHVTPTFNKQSHSSQEVLREYDDIVFDDPSIVTKSNISDSEIRKMIQEEVKKYVREYLKDQAEKISWEIIPDVAEKIIRSELDKISSEVLKKF